jgi:hypothetical protein
MERDLLIRFDSIAKTLVIDREHYRLSEVEISFVQTRLTGDTRSLGEIIREMKAEFPEFYLQPEAYTSGDVSQAIERVISEERGLLKADGTSTHDRLLTGHPTEYAGRPVAENEVVVCFDWILSGDKPKDLGPVAMLEGFNIFRKLPVQVQAGIRYLFFEVGKQARFIVRRPKERGF